MSYAKYFKRRRFMALMFKLSLMDKGRPEKEYVFEEPTQFLVGRADDCNIQLPGDAGHYDGSPHHCLVAFDPPFLRIRDLGSRNGTYLNGAKIGQRPLQSEPELEDSGSGQAFELKDGDEIRVGAAVFRISMIVGDDNPDPVWFPSSIV